MLPEAKRLPELNENSAGKCSPNRFSEVLKSNVSEKGMRILRGECCRSKAVSRAEREFRGEMLPEPIYGGAKEQRFRKVNADFQRGMLPKQGGFPSGARIPWWEMLPKPIFGGAKEQRFRKGNADFAGEMLPEAKRFPELNENSAGKCCRSKAVSRAEREFRGGMLPEPIFGGAKEQRFRKVNADFQREMLPKQSGFPS